MIIQMLFNAVNLDMLKIAAALISIYRIYKLVRQLLQISPLLRAVSSSILVPSDLPGFKQGQFVICEGRICSRFPSRTLNVYQSLRSYISIFQSRLYKSQSRVDFLASQIQLKESGSESRIALANLAKAKFYQSKTLQNDQQTSFITDFIRVVLLVLRPSQFNISTLLRNQHQALPLMQKVVVLGKLIKNNSSMALEGVIVAKSVRYIKNKLRRISRSIKFKLVLYLMVLAFLAVWLVKKIKRNALYDQQIHDDDIDQRLNCIICLQRKRSFLSKACRHLVMCMNCFQNLPQKVCPVCKIDIQEGIKVSIQNN